jgi:hypothetical protein
MQQNEKYQALVDYLRLQQDFSLNELTTAFEVNAVSTTVLHKRGLIEKVGKGKYRAVELNGLTGDKLIEWCREYNNEKAKIRQESGHKPKGKKITISDFLKTLTAASGIDRSIIKSDAIKVKGLLNEISLVIDKYID